MLYCIVIYSIISIHALRVEGDSAVAAKESRRPWISIHALRVEGDKLSACRKDSMSLFLSTPSVWRATGGAPTFGSGQTISIHALRVEGDRDRANRREDSGKISIHALRVEGDVSPVGRKNRHERFLSTPSVWRATKKAMQRATCEINFYPRPPCGGRR